ncbi:hypothetical protein ACJMK2_008611 [Sinanodonta woodiana]|uniref:Uncharacterized protein n=1 Tax=Sinanodonta woodiana TaxID=1069815 RepID=A0ABD3VQ67_SINWO
MSDRLEETRTKDCLSIREKVKVRSILRDMNHPSFKDNQDQMSVPHLLHECGLEAMDVPVKTLKVEASVQCEENRRVGAMNLELFNGPARQGVINCSSVRERKL